MNAVAPLATDDEATASGDLLAQIRAARVYEVAHESALEAAPLLSARLGQHVLLKREDQQPVFSFKLRGAYNRMVQLDAAQRARGVIAASAGNHAQGVALAAAKLGIRATIVMPVTAPQVKVDAVRRFGGALVDVVLAGDSYSDAQAAAAQLQAERGAVFVHPFDDPAVIAGQGTIALEILRQHPGPLQAVFVPVGGGGLLAGVAACIKALRPDVKVIGVQAVDSDAMARSLEAGDAYRAGRGRPVRRRHRGEAGRRADFRAVPAARRTRCCGWTPTRSAPRSATSTRTPAACRNRPARWRWPD